MERVIKDGRHRSRSSQNIWLPILKVLCLLLPWPTLLLQSLVTIRGNKNVKKILFFN